MEVFKIIDFLSTSDTTEEWISFISTINNNPTARDITLDAWKRCEDLGLGPDSIKLLNLSDEEIKQKVLDNSQLVEVAQPYLDSLSLSLTGVPHIVALSDAEGWIIDIRGTPEELGGRKAGLCLGASWAEKNIGNNGIGTALSTESPVLVYGVEHFGMVYDGCACMGVPIVSNGKIIGALDISVANRYAHPARLHIAIACVNSIESTLSHYNKKSSSLSAYSELTATSELISTAIHDLKNPLSVIRGLGQLGNLTSDTSVVHNYFGRIISQVDEMNNMLMELLDIYKPVTLTPHKIAGTIEDVLYAFEPICKSKNITLSLINNTDACINMCTKLFKRTVENLITNAVQAMDDNGGLIEVITEVDNDSILITIRDNAGGLTEDVKETLFEPFSSKKIGGTGLGLFMAYHTITEIHKGQIWFESNLGLGTTFCIKLPIIQEVNCKVSAQETTT